MTSTDPAVVDALLTDEQAAIRRVATLVAEGATAADVLAAVVEEVARALGVATVILGRYEPERAVTILASLDDTFAPGTRWPLDGPSVGAVVLETGCPARIDDYSELPGTIAAGVRESEMRSTVAVPITVEGDTWGVMTVASHRPAPLPPETEARLRDFTELVGAAIANAQSREALSVLAREQAALRRVATFVAREASPQEIFRMVTDEACRVLGTEAVGMLRFESDGSATLVAQSRTPWEPPPLGTRLTLEGENVVAQVLRTGQAARVDDWSTATGSVAAMAHVLGVRSSVATPILVERRLWGVMVAATNQSEPLPGDTESRIGEFTELVATAIANAEARAEMERLAEEQAALRRVATVVAEGTTAVPLFSAVAAEVAKVIGASGAEVDRYQPDGTVLILATWREPDWTAVDDVLYVGMRWTPDPGTLTAAIQETRKPARLDDYSDVPGVIGESSRAAGIGSACAAPIIVDGGLWGAIRVFSRGDAELAADAESRLHGFTELVATAISNSQAHDDLRDLVEEQAALRRVATLVARGAPSAEVFAAVAAEVGKVFDTDITIVGRYDGDGAATAIGNWSASPGGVPVGTRSELGGRNVLTMVAETGRPARLDGYDEASGEAADIARRHGWRSSIAAPIVVEDRLWGVMLVATQRPESFPAEAEEKLAAFTDLVATAVGNAQAHDELLRFGDEQAALGRVATLVAAGASQEQVFTTVVGEVSSLLGLERIELVRYDGAATGTVVAASGDHPFPAGSTWSLDDPSVMATVARTGRAARIDDYSSLGGEIARAARSAGFESAIGAPITVEGALWGAIVAISTDPEPIPEPFVARLGQFTALVATALANTQAREQVTALADEQAALRRVATLVAEGAESRAVFDAVCAETGPLVGASVVNLSHYTPDGFNVTMAGWSMADTHIPVGARFPLAPDTIGGEITRTRAPARMDSWEGATSDLARVVRDRGIRSSVGAPIVVDGQLWGALVAATDKDETLAAGTEFRLARFTQLIATAISNAATRSQLIASRARIVAAGDEARRRIERNLHDGTQQRLIAIGLDVQRVRASVPGTEHETLAGLDRVGDDLEAVLEDVRELSRGLHPPMLSRRGLRAALTALARRSPIPVELEIDLRRRPPEPVETAVYYVVSEALVNAIRYSNASAISVAIGTRRGDLHATIADDGDGGAVAVVGSGLVGLSDRVEALGGRFALDSPLGEGTRISIVLPLAPFD